MVLEKCIDGCYYSIRLITPSTFEMSRDKIHICIPKTISQSHEIMSS